MITRIDLDEDIIILNSSQIVMFNKIFESYDKGLRINRNHYVEFSNFGAFACGKSYIMQLTAYLICLYYPGVNILYTRQTYNELKSSVIKQMLRDFKKYNNFIYKETKMIFKFANGSTIDFHAFDVDTKILSNEYDCIFVCQAEELAEALFLQLLGRNRGQRLPKNLLCVEGNPSNNYIKRRYEDLSEEARVALHIFYITTDSFDNKKNLPEDYIERLIANYPKSWVNRYVYGGWDQIDEMVFSEFRKELHVIDPLTIEECQYFLIRQGFDYGWINETAIVWCYVDYDGNLTIFEEWGGSYKYNDEISENALKYGKFKMMADTSMKRVENGKSVWTDLSKTLALSECNKHQRDNIITINQLFKKRSIRITRNCVRTITQIRNTKWKKLKLGSDKNHPEEIMDKNTDFFDSFTYVVIEMAGKRTQTEDEKRYPHTIAAATHRKSTTRPQLY